MRYVLILFTGVCVWLICSCNSQLEKLPEVTHPPVKEFLTAADAHLGVNMKNMHYFNNKMGIAIRKYNFSLAQFYNSELREVAEELIAKKIIDNGINISEQINIMLLPSVKIMEENLTGSSIEKIKTGYQNLITACNSCHVATEHGFIVIEEPTGTIDGQNFEPVMKTH